MNHLPRSSGLLLAATVLVGVINAYAQPERVLVQDQLAGQTTGKQQGAGEFVTDGGWRSAGGRIVYDAGEPVEKGYFEATLRGVTLPAVGAAKSNVLSAWESGEPFRSGKEKGSNWMLRMGTSCHLKLLAFSDGSVTRYETNVDKYPVNGEAHRYRVQWNRGHVVYTIDGKLLGEFRFPRMSVRYFVIGIDNSFASDALTDPAPIISDVRLVSQSAPMPTMPPATETVERYGVFEKALTLTPHPLKGAEPSGGGKAPFRGWGVATTATFTRHAGGTYTIPLFYDGNQTFRVRFAPDAPGRWTWRITSSDAKLNGQSGVFTCVPSDRKGGLVAKGHAPSRELVYQNGAKYWLLGDTNWQAFAGDPAENLNAQTFRQYVNRRLDQGFTFLQTTLLSDRNEGGQPFLDGVGEYPNPAYWQEVDRRVQYLNERGLVPLLTMAWAEPTPTFGHSWAMFRSDETRLRYARYVVARYSAYNVAFALAGGLSDPAQDAFIRKAGQVAADADPHDRWITVLSDAGREGGSVSRFAGEPWMTFQDYRTGSANLYTRNFVTPLPQTKITIQTGDFCLFQPGLTNVDDIRHAVWDVVMAGNYPVLAFANTQLGGQGFVGTFADRDADNDAWLRQLRLIPHFFHEVVTKDNGRAEWSWIKPFHRSFRADTFIRASVGRSADGPNKAPPNVMHSVLAKEGKGFTAVVYMRGHAGPHTLTPLHDPLDPGAKLGQRVHSIHRFNPRTGEYVHERDVTGESPTLTLTPPDAQDWVFVVQRKNIFDPVAIK